MKRRSTVAKIILEDKETNKVLRAAGPLSIQDASALRDALLNAFDTTERLLIDLTGSESMDLACIQTLCSAHKTFIQANKGIDITGGLPEGIAASLSGAGVTPENCDITPHGRCMWASGGDHE
jgi:anti-anti-sigma regulatory factor